MTELQTKISNTNFRFVTIMFAGYFFSTMTILIVGILFFTGKLIAPYEIIIIIWIGSNVLLSFGIALMIKLQALKLEKIIREIKNI